LEGLVTEV